MTERFSAKGGQYSPTYAELKKLSRKSNFIPVYRRIVGDFETPVSCFAKTANSHKHCALLESVEGGERWGRYSFIIPEPSEIITRGKFDGVTDALRARLKTVRPARVDGLPRFWGGAVGYCSYDVVRQFENLPDSPRDDLKLPEAIFFLTDGMIVFDHLFHSIRVVACVDLRGGLRPTKKLYASACRRIDAVIKKIESPSVFSKAPPASNRRRARQKIVSNTSPAKFMAAVARAKNYIRAGDVIQVVLSQRFQSDTSASPFDVYRALRMINPSPYMYFFRFDDFYVIGSSPEILVRKEGSAAITKPIAGTRPRSGDPAKDAALAAELLRDPKERAEHIMLVDLGRNDLSRVCEPGTVKTSELMQIEKYSHVMHMVSTVSGELKPSADAFDLFRACFPAGTVTGAPKVRAMQIIDELEPSARGPYAGAVGYFSYDGNMDTAITIRTIIRKGRVSYVQAGAGIVADSVPSKELRETRNKARALFKALELARGLRSR